VEAETLGKEVLDADYIAREVIMVLGCAVEVIYRKSMR